MKCTREMMTRERNLWLTDHPGATVEDFDRVSRPGGNRRTHSEYLTWLNTARVMRIVGLAPMSERGRMSFERAKQEPKPRRRRGKTKKYVTVILFDELLAAVLDEAKQTKRMRGQTKYMTAIDEAHFFRGDLPGFIDRATIDKAVPPPTKKS